MRATAARLDWARQTCHSFAYIAGLAALAIPALWPR